MTLDPNLQATLQALQTSSNQQTVGAALDRAINSGATVPAGFTSLYSLSGAALSNALAQLTGTTPCCLLRPVLGFAVE